MKFLSLFQVLELHRQIIKQSGGSLGIRDLDALESAVSQPQMTFDQQELYPTLHEKAAALAHSLAMNHPFIDGNKRVAHAAMEVFLLLNGHEIDATVGEQEQTFLELANGNVSRKQLAKWLSGRIIPKQ